MKVFAARVFAISREGRSGRTPLRGLRDLRGLAQTMDGAGARAFRGLAACRGPPRPWTAPAQGRSGASRPRPSPQVENKRDCRKCDARSASRRKDAGWRSKTARGALGPQIAPPRDRACFVRDASRTRGKMGCQGASQRQASSVSISSWPASSSVTWGPSSATSRLRSSLASRSLSARLALATLIISLMRLSWLTSEAPGS